MNDRDTILRSVRAALRGRVDELPPAPAAAVKLLRLTSDEGANLSEISHVIETEPAIAAKVLQVVNSAYYGFPRNIRSIPRAVTLLGFSVVRQAALHLLVYEGMIKRGARGAAFDRLFFWQHSLLVAILSRGIGERLGHPDPDSLYTAGLLHDLGKVVLEAHGRVRYSEFLVACANSGNPNRDDERTFFGVSHDTVGSYISEHWGMPKLVCRVQAMHHSPFLGKGLSPQEAQEVAIVALADFIAWTQGIGSVQTLGSPWLSPDVRELLDPDQLDLATLLEKADAEITEIGTFYGLKFPSPLQLRANMVATAISLSQADGAGDEHPPAPEARVSHTAPHQSLDPDEFIPNTLEALQREFGISRLMMLQIDPQRRSLVATHFWPIRVDPAVRGAPEMAIPSLSGDLVQCLRERHPVVIDRTPENAEVLARLGLSQGAAVPVMSRGRLLGLLWVDRDASEIPLGVVTLDEIQRVAGELGIALERSRTFAQERAKAEVDALTRLHNRAALDRFLANCFRQAAESGRVFALGLLDVDHFKRFNDTFGHQSGDDVLRIVADTLRNLTRPNDFLARYGGEEFLFVLVNTGTQGAESYAERIRCAIEERGRLLIDRFPGHALTASVGVAVYEPRLQGPAQLIGAADQALYRAKRSGRNRVVPAWLSNGAT